MSRQRRKYGQGGSRGQAKCGEIYLGYSKIGEPRSLCWTEYLNNDSGRGKGRRHTFKPLGHLWYTQLTYDSYSVTPPRIYVASRTRTVDPDTAFPCRASARLFVRLKISSRTGGILGTYWTRQKGYRPEGLKNQHVMEEVREVDGYHQTLLSLPCHWSKLKADGAVR